MFDPTTNRTFAKNIFMYILFFSLICVTICVWIDIKICDGNADPFFGRIVHLRWTLRFFGLLSPLPFSNEFFSWVTKKAGAGSGWNQHVHLLRVKKKSFWESPPEQVNLRFPCHPSLFQMSFFLELSKKAGSG
jgi:hypothetical protein